MTTATDTTTARNRLQLLGRFAGYFVGQDGKPVNERTLRRWARQGARMSTGHLARLKVVPQPGGLCTTRGWILDFVREVYGDEAVAAVIEQEEAAKAAG